MKDLEQKLGQQAYLVGDEYRGHPVCAWASRMYREHRSRPAS